MRKAFTFPEKVIVFCAYALFVLLRLPENPLTGGRVVIEDATVFFSYAWHAANFHQAAFHSFAGYLNLTANLSAYIATLLIKRHVFSLYNLPVILESIAFIFQTIPAILLLWGKSDWLPSRRFVFMALLIIAVSPKADGVWLNIMHIQFWLTLCCAIILVLDTDCSWPMLVFREFILLLAPLAGPTSLLLGPFFLARSYFDRSFPRFLQTATLGLSGLVQIFFFYKPLPFRAHHLDLSLIINTAVYRSIIVSCLSPASKKIGEFFIYLMDSHNWFVHSLWIGQTVFSAIFISFIFYEAFRFRKKTFGYILPLSVFFLIFTYSFGALVFHPEDALRAWASRRYQFIPVIFVGFAFIAMHAQDKKSLWYKASNIFLVLYFVSGFISLLRPIYYYGPEWGKEVAAWEKDHDYRPQPRGFSLGADLSDTPVQACSNSRTGPLAALAPSYCEENWIITSEEYCLYKKTLPNLKANYQACP